MRDIFEGNINILNCYNKINKNGYVVLNQKIKENICDEYSAIINKLTQTKKRVELSMCTNLLSKDKKFSELVFNNQILTICQKFFNLDYNKDLNNSFQLNAIHSRKIDLPSLPQNLHVDSKIPGIYPPLYASIIIYLDDVDVSMGPTRVIPGSHKIVKLPKSYSEKKTKLITGKKGTVIFLNSSMRHGAYKKINDKSRTIILLTYNRWFVRQNFANPFNLSKKFISKLTKKQKQIIGIYNYSPISTDDKKLSGSLNEINKNFRMIFRNKVKNYYLK